MEKKKLKKPTNLFFFFTLNVTQEIKHTYHPVPLGKTNNCSNQEIYADLQRHQNPCNVLVHTRAPSKHWRMDVVLAFNIYLISKKPNFKKPHAKNQATVWLFFVFFFVWFAKGSNSFLRKGHVQGCTSLSDSRLVLAPQPFHNLRLLIMVYRCSYLQ